MHILGKKDMPIVFHVTRYAKIFPAPPHLVYFSLLPCFHVRTGACSRRHSHSLYVAENGGTEFSPEFVG